MLYYINKNAQYSGEHEIHTSNCVFLPSVENRIFLGCFNKPSEALKAAKQYFNNVDGCFYCCPESHKK